MSKSASPTTYTAAGQVINYTYTITNQFGTDGTLASLTDDKATITDCPSGTTVPAAGITCHGTYTTTGADITAAPRRAMLAMTDATRLQRQAPRSDWLCQRRRSPTSIRIAVRRRGVRA